MALTNRFPYLFIFSKYLKCLGNNKHLFRHVYKGRLQRFVTQQIINLIFKFDQEVQTNLGPSLRSKIFSQD